MRQRPTQLAQRDVQGDAPRVRAQGGSHAEVRRGGDVRGDPSGGQDQAGQRQPPIAVAPPPAPSQQHYRRRKGEHAGLLGEQNEAARHLSQPPSGCESPAFRHRSEVNEREQNLEEDQGLNAPQRILPRRRQPEHDCSQQREQRSGHAPQRGQDRLEKQPRRGRYEQRVDGGLQQVVPLPVQPGQREGQQPRQHRPVVIQRSEKVAPSQPARHPGCEQIDGGALPLIPVRQAGAEAIDEHQPPAQQRQRAPEDQQPPGAAPAVGQRCHLISMSVQAVQSHP